MKRRLISIITIISMIFSFINSTAIISLAANNRVFTYDGYKVEYTVTDEWNGGQNINVKLINIGTEPIHLKPKDMSMWINHIKLQMR